MKTDNILVSREWLEKLITAVEYMATCEQLRGSGQAQYKAILAMPDFIESERDVEVVRKAIMNIPFNNREWKEESYAKAAINALQYRKEGGE